MAGGLPGASAILSAPPGFHWVCRAAGVLSGLLGFRRARWAAPFFPGAAEDSPDVGRAPCAAPLIADRIGLMRGNVLPRP